MKFKAWGLKNRTTGKLVTEELAIYPSRQMARWAQLDGESVVKIEVLIKEAA